MIKKSRILILLLLCFFVSQLKASYCYSPLHFFKIVIENKDVFLEITTKDHDRISYVSKGKIKIKNLTADSLQIVSEIGPQILVTYNAHYYSIDKNSYYLDKHGATQLVNTKDVSKVLYNKYFLINKIWHQITVDTYTREVSKKKILNLPIDVEVIKDYGRGYLLIKDAKSVYVYNEKDNKLKNIPRLYAKHTQYFEGGWTYDSHFLFDDDTFYLININFDYTDITSEFQLLGKKDGFSKFEAFNPSLIAFDSQDGYLWTYNKHGVELKNGQRVNFYPIKARFITGEKDLVLYNDNIYNYGDYAVSQHFSLDISEIENISKLQRRGSFYTDSINVYARDYDKNTFRKIDWLSPNYSITHGYYVDGGYMKKGDKNGMSLAIKITSPIKDYGGCYTYNDKIVIREMEVPNILEEDFVFIGSTTDIIRPCDDRGTPPTLINNYHFFKDKNGVYSFYTGECRLKKIPKLNPDDFNVDNYEDLMRLTDLDRRTVNADQ